MNRIVVFALFMIFYISGHFLVYRLYSSVFKIKLSRIIMLFLIYFFAFLYIIVRIFDKYLPDNLQIFLNLIGGFWFAVVSYLLIFTIIYYLLFVFHVIHSKFFETELDITRLRFYYIISSSVFVLMVIIYGYFNAVSPRIREFQIITDKNLPQKEIRIVMASDIHLGYLIGRNAADILKQKINSLNPDIVLIPGDIVDGEINYITQKDSGRPLSQISSRYGVFASMGNHDYFGGGEITVKYVAGLGMRMLRDEAVTVADSITVIGRNNVSFGHRENIARKPLDEIISAYNIDMSDFIILLDHEPSKLDDALNNEIDLQLSGHTHNGQFWPFSLIVNRIYELPWGFMQKGQTSYYVSCGYGTWGPRIRIGSRSEIIVFTIKSRQQK